MINYFQEVLPSGSRNRRNLLSKARIKTTNLAMTMVLIFIMTNLPYIVDEFFKQRFVSKDQCQTEVCLVLKVKEIITKMILIHFFQGISWCDHGLQLRHQPLHLPPLQLKVISSSEAHSWVLPTHQAFSRKVTVQSIWILKHLDFSSISLS